MKRVNLSRRYCTHCNRKFYIESLKEIHYPLLKKTAFHCLKCLSAYKDNLHTFLNPFKPQIIDLFSGSNSLKKALIDFPYSVFSIDINSALSPNLSADILTLSVNDIPNKRATFAIWASVPCTTFSILNSRHHWKPIRYSHRRYYYTPTTNAARESIRLLEKTLHIIRSINPAYYFIENPRGVLRHMPQMNAIPFRSTVSYHDYGAPVYKPTDIFHNVPGLDLSQLKGSVGRTFPAQIASMNNAATRAVVPPALIQSIFSQLKHS